MERETQRWLEDWSEKWHNKCGERHERLSDRLLKMDDRIGSVEGDIKALSVRQETSLAFLKAMKLNPGIKSTTKAWIAIITTISLGVLGGLYAIFRVIVYFSQRGFSFDSLMK